MTDFLKPDWERLNVAFNGNTRPVFAFYDESGRIVPLIVVEANQTRWYGSSNKHEHFGTWQQVYALRDMAKYRGYGPCMLLREDDNTVCIDLDGYEPPPNKPFNEFDEKQHTARIDAMARDAAAKGNLVERSRSGRGWHIFTRGSWPNRMDDLPHGMGEIFGKNQHINLTGIEMSVPNKKPTHDFLAEIKRFIFGGEVKVKADELASLDLIETDAYGRRLDLTDEQIIEVVEKFGGENDSHTRMKEVYGLFFFCERTMTSHSEDMYKLASFFDKLTGDHNQVMRLLERSQLYRLQPVDAKGEDRMKKFGANARKAFLRIRLANNKALDDAGTAATWGSYQRWHLTSRMMPTLRLIERSLRIKRVRNLMLTEAQSRQYVKELDSIPDESNKPQIKGVAGLVRVRDDQKPTEQSYLPTQLIDWPPGIAGEMARDFYEMQHFPNQTIAIIWALSVLSGYAQRSYVCSGVALNGYYLLGATTGTGKDMLMVGANRLFTQISSGSSMFHNLHTIMNVGDVSHGSALTQHVATNPRSYAIFNEVSFLFEAMSNKADTTAASKKKVLLDLRWKGSPDNIQLSKVYAQKEMKIAPVSMPCFTMLAEGQPARIYDSISIGLYIDGFMQRFVYVDASVAGKPTRREDHEIRKRFRPEVIAGLQPLFYKAASTNHIPEREPEYSTVQVSQEAFAVLYEYEAVLRDYTEENQPVRFHAYNRFGQQCFALAGLLAVADNGADPVVTKQHMEWVTYFNNTCIDFLATKVERREVGSDQDRLATALAHVIKKFPTNKMKAIGDLERQLGIFPLYWLTKETSRSKYATLFAGKGHQGNLDRMQMTLNYLIGVGAVHTVTEDELARVGRKRQGSYYKIGDLKRILGDNEE